MNRFYDCAGDVSIQLAPWESERRGLDPSISMFLLQERLRFRSDIAGGDLIVPAGFLSDLASIPRIAWTVFADPDAPFIELGAWVHDYLYGHVGKVAVHPGADPPGWTALTRKQCDQILCFEAMPDLGAAAWQRRAVYGALRLFGAGAFKTDKAT
jgi:Protein of unknown function (DUF1353)